MYKEPYKFKNLEGLCDKLDKVIKKANELQKHIIFSHINKHTIEYPSYTYVLQAKYNDQTEYTVISNLKYQYDPRPYGEYIVANARFLLTCFKDFSEL